MCCRSRKRSCSASTLLSYDRQRTYCTVGSTRIRPTIRHWMVGLMFWHCFLTQAMASSIDHQNTLLMESA
eukprot:1987527-Pyramimonas_sp.AAC.1